MSEFVHIVRADKFVQGFVDFMGDTFADFPERHRLYVIGRDAEYPVRDARNITVVEGRSRYAAILMGLQGARKIFFHGLFDRALPRLMALRPALLARSHWLIWGGDLYDPVPPMDWLRDRIDDWAKANFIRRAGHLVTYIPGDVEQARRRFGARGEFRRCLLYPSNVVVAGRGVTHRPPDTPLRLLAGNSAAATNHHFELFDLLAQRLGSRDARIFVPLSYGDADYAQAVEARGHQLFGHRFVPLNRFMPLGEYHALLDSIDIAFFNQRRQQGAGNIIHLLGRGKKVCLRPEATTWTMLTTLGITVHDAREADLSLMDRGLAEANIRLVGQHFSLDALRAQWKALLEDGGPSPRVLQA